MTQGWAANSMFAGIESVDATGMRLPRVPDGSHLLLIDRCLVPRGPGGQSGQNAFVVEFTVQQSHNPHLVPGSKCSAYLSSKFRDSWLKQVKAFAAAACGFDIRVPEQDQAFGPYSNNAVELSVGEHNVFAARSIVCEASFSGKYDKKQQPYFNYVWWPHGEAMNMAALPVAVRQAPAPQQPVYQQPTQQWGGPPQQQGFVPQAPPGVPPAYGPSGNQYGAPQGPPGVPPQAWGAQQAPPQQQQGFAPPTYGQQPQGPQQQQGFAPPQGSPYGGWRR